MPVLTTKNEFCSGLGLVTSCSAFEVPKLRATMSSVQKQVEAPWHWTIVIEGVTRVPDFLEAENIQVLISPGAISSAAARNIGVLNSPYAGVRILNPGDVLHMETTLSRELQVLLQKCDSGAIIPREAETQDDGTLSEVSIFAGGELPVKFVQRRWYCAETRFGFLARKSDILEVGGFPSLTGCEDLLMVNLLNRERPIYAIPNFLSSVRGGPGLQELPELSYKNLGQLITSVT